MICTPAAIAAALGSPAVEAAITPHWQAALAARPAGALACLDPALIPARRADLGLPAACDPPLLAVAQAVRGDPALAAVAWYLHWRIFVGPERGCPAAPALEPRLGGLTGAFFLLLALEFKPALAARHQAWGYPEDVTAACLSQVAGYLDNHQRGTGGLGCYGGQVCWLRTYFDFPYVRLGRLAYQLMPCAAPIAVWRRSSDGTLLALARDGLAIDGDGLIARQGEVPAWTAHLDRSEAAVEGHPVDPAGYIQRHRVRLDLSVWTPFLAAGDPILSIHIPPGGGMDLATVQDSFRQAQAFFARHHPEQPARALWCNTWFLDPRLARLLPATANPLRLQRCLYLHPVEPWGDGGLWFVFLRPTTDPATLPRDTSVQRALADFLAAGGRWHGGGGFIPLEAAGTLVEERWRDGFAEVARAARP